MIKNIKDNIIVREYNSEDYASFITQLCDNEEWTNVFQLWNLKGENAVKFFAHHLEQYKTLDIKENGLMLGIFTKNGLLIGECGFEYNKGSKSVEIFIGLIGQAQGKGFAKEVVDALCEISKELGINVIHANVPEAHTICTKIFDKSKFKFSNDYDLAFNNMTIKMRHYIYK